MESRKLFRRFLIVGTLLSPFHDAGSAEAFLFVPQCSISTTATCKQYERLRLPHHDSLLSRKKRTQDGNLIELCGSSSGDNSSSSEPTPTTNSQKRKIVDFDLVLSIMKELWFLPILSILSGFTPATRIVAESHVSRLPDTPIAHDIDTFLLWPFGHNNIGTGTFDSGATIAKSYSWTIFQTPAAAITESTQYDVDWDAVRDTYVTNVGMSLIYSGILVACLYLYLSYDESLVDEK